MANYRNPGPRRGEPKVGSGPEVAFPVDRSGSAAEFREAHFYCKKLCFWTIFGELGTIFGSHR